MLKIILYSNNCPRCRILESQLKSHQIDFYKEEDITLLVQKGYSSAPMLQVEDKFLDFNQAIQWVGSYKNEK